jgi:hypothetical protein
MVMSLRPISFHAANRAAEGPSFGLGAGVFCPTASDSKKLAIVAISKNLRTSDLRVRLPEVSSEYTTTKFVVIEVLLS